MRTQDIGVNMIMIIVQIVININEVRRNMTILVYSKPSCMQCIATKRALDTRGIDYQSIDLSQNESALEKVIQLGYREAPVVITGTKHWSGFRPDLIEQLCAD